MKDVVCGSNANPELCKFRERYKEQDYFFCSEACRNAFLKNPERHIPWKPGGPDRRQRDDSATSG